MTAGADPLKPMETLDSTIKWGALLIVWAAFVPVVALFLNVKLASAQVMDVSPRSTYYTTATLIVALFLFFIGDRMAKSLQRIRDFARIRTIFIRALVIPSVAIPALSTLSSVGTKTDAFVMSLSFVVVSFSGLVSAWRRFLGAVEGVFTG